MYTLFIESTEDALYCAICHYWEMKLPLTWNINEIIYIVFWHYNHIVQPYLWLTEYCETRRVLTDILHVQTPQGYNLYVVLISFNVRERGKDILFQKFSKELKTRWTLSAQLCVCLAAANPVIVFQSNQPVVVENKRGLTLLWPNYSV